MQTPRITSASLFVTVLSACLGLAMAGLPMAHAHTQEGIRTAVSKSQALAVGATVQQLSPQQARKLAAVSNSYFQVADCHLSSDEAAPVYENSRALISKNRLLVVTRLPRAALIGDC
ncbi:MAG TPA: hypothetical protein VF544_06645 [Pyrinomonadaceae bacterium]|jgi:hypothetical protein